MNILKAYLLEFVSSRQAGENSPVDYNTGKLRKRSAMEKWQEALSRESAIKSNAKKYPNDQTRSSRREKNPSDKRTRSERITDVYHNYRDILAHKALERMK